MDRSAYSAGDQAAPSILRFASDDFMEHLLAMLAADPRQVSEVIARPETWRTEVGVTPDLVQRVPMPRIARALARVKTNGTARTAVAAARHEDTVTESGVSRTLPLKLYHPAHQRHYLVTANLVCGTPGFPDHAVAGGGREKVGYVLRRLMLPPGTADESKREEFGFIKDASGARWQRVTSTSAAATADAGMVDGEEMLPLFPLAFRDDVDHPRRMFGGVIPVARRDEYLGTRAHRGAPAVVAGGASAHAAIRGATVVSARKAQFKLDIAEPWKHLIRTAYFADAMMNDETPEVVASWTAAKKREAADRLHQRLQGESWLLLLDFADYLYVHLPNVWKAVEDRSKAGSLTVPEAALFTFLDTTDSITWPVAVLTPTFKPTNAPAFVPTLRDALRKIRAHRDTLERTTRTYPDAGNWPGFSYLMAGVRCTFSPDGFKSGGPWERLAPARSTDKPAFETDGMGVDKIVALVVRALDKTQGEPSPAVPFAERLRDALVSTQGDEGWFVLRCAYVRCDCGPLDPTLMSVPSQRFQLASFFDPDAPARSIQISLPFDTTPAGLRKHSKGAAFVMSDVLCGQVQRAKGLGLIDLVRSVLPWPLHKDLDNGKSGPCTTKSGGSMGMICSLSIPIVTICALILLMIIVSLLDIVFKWMPYLIFCFPIPGLKAKPVKES